MQSRQTFMAAMGGVDPGEEAFGEYDEARRRPARPPPSLCSCVALRTCVRPGAGRVHGRAVVIQAFGRACLCTVCARPPPSAVLLPASDAFSKYSKTRAASYFYLPPEGLQHGAWRDGGRLHAAHPRSHCTQA